MAGDCAPAETIIVIVNWRNPWDTLECLGSLLAMSHREWTAVVVDNHSGDDSLALFHAWAEGLLCACQSSADPRLPQSLRNRGCANDLMVSFVRSNSDQGHLEEVPSRQQGYRSIVFVENAVNAGFAGGNNVGLRLALARPEVRWVWLLNNDTVVDPSALTELMAKSQRHPGEQIVGARVMEYFDPGTVQYSGGAQYNQWLASVAPVREVRPSPASPQTDADHERHIEQRLSYIVGASMFMPRTTLMQLGLMDERYFLYYEELDWRCRHEAAVSLKYASRAVVFHKEGGTTGGKTLAPIKSRTAEYFAARARILFALRRKPWLLATLLPLQSAAMVKRLVRDRGFDRARIVFSATVDAVKIALTGRGIRP